jgi:hypothetical protein
VSRRRISDANNTKPGGTGTGTTNSRSGTGDGLGVGGIVGGDHGETKGGAINGIKEEPDDDTSTILAPQTGNKTAEVVVTLPTPEAGSGTASGAGGDGTNSVRGSGTTNGTSTKTSITKTNTNTNTATNTNPGVSHTDFPTAANVFIALPLDLKTVEWSYIDPAGNTQGPFEASVMQQWHDAGFFSPDLRMKRTVMDRVWTTAGEKMRRAGEEDREEVRFRSFCNRHHPRCSQQRHLGWGCRTPVLVQGRARAHLSGTGSSRSSSRLNSSDSSISQRKGLFLPRLGLRLMLKHDLRLKITVKPRLKIFLARRCSPLLNVDGMQRSIRSCLAVASASAPALEVDPAWDMGMDMLILMGW